MLRNWRITLIRVVVILASLFLTTCKALAQCVTLKNTEYRVLYNTQKMSAERVSWTLKATSIGQLSRSVAGSFRVDKRVPKPRQSSSDYTGSGYDRGHLCPAADWSGSVSLMAETFLMTNVVPMTRVINRGVWKSSEIKCRALAILYDSVKVVVDVWWFSDHPNTISKKRIPVPDAFGKQVFRASNDSLITEWYVKNQ